MFEIDDNKSKAFNKRMKESESIINEEWITAAEAAKLWNLNDSTIRRAIRDGRIRADECRKSSGTWLVLKSAIERLYGKPKLLY